MRTISAHRWAVISVVPVLVGLVAVVLIGNGQELAPPTIEVSDVAVDVTTDAETVRIRPEQLEAVTLEAQLPRFPQSFGWHSRAALRGSFRTDGRTGYVHVSRQHPPYIVIRTSNKLLIFNYADESRTREVYSRILRVQQASQ